MRISTSQHLKPRLLAALVLAAGLPCLAQTYWSGGADTNWSNALNWAPNVPDASAQVLFDDSYTASFTSVQNAINNVVDAGLASPSIRSLQYQSAAASHYYGTWIPTNQTLTLADTVPGTILGAGSFTSSSTSLNDYFSIAGPGTLSVNNPAGTIDIHQVASATLNLSNLATFTASVSNVWVGAQVNTSVSSVRNSPLGTLNLARTNTITTAANPSAPGILLGRGGVPDGVTWFGGTGYGRLQLGAQNTFNTDGLVVGGSRAVTFSPSSRMFFTAGTVSNQFTLRGSAGGSTPAAVFSIADGSAGDSGYSDTPYGTSSVYGDVDFSNGSVDILVGTLNVGRTPFDSSDPVNNRGAAIGTLLFEQGTITATNVNLGYYQYQQSASSGQGALTARSNAVLNVYSNLTLAYLRTTNGLSSFSSTSGTLNLSNNAVANIGGNLVDGGGITTLTLNGGGINMQPGWAATPGNVDVKNLSGSGVISNAGTIRLNGTIIPGTLATPAPLILGGSVTMDTNSVVYYNVGTNNNVGLAGGSDYIGIGGNTAQFNNTRMFLTLSGGLIPGAVYRLIDCTNATSVTGSVNAESPRYAPVMVTSTGVVMVVSANTNVGSVTWNGSLGPVWDTSLFNTNWIYQGAQDAYHQNDNVVFDDTCVSPVIWPSGQLAPSSITFNGNTQTLWVTNRSGVTPWGSITGSGGITKNGTNTVVWGIATNTFTGPVNINNGVLKVFDPTFTTPGGALVLGPTNGPVNVANGATLDVSGISSISPGKTNFVSGNGFNGMGVIANTATSGNPTWKQYFRLMGDSTFVLNTAPFTIQNPAGTVTYGGWVDLNGFTLTKSGASYLVIAQSSVTNTGNLNLAGGELRLNHTWLSGSGSLNLSNGTTLSCYGSGTTNVIAKTSLNIPANASVIAPYNGSAGTSPFLIGSPISLGGTLLLSNAMTTQITNVISGGGALTKSGNSNLVLTAANTYTGPTTVNQGRLVLPLGGTIVSTNITINNPGIFDVTGAGYTLTSGQSLTLNATNAVVGNVTVGSGATVLGTGTNNGNLTVNDGGVLSPGTLATVGTLRVTTNLTLNGAALIANLGGNTNLGGADNDLVLCSNLTLSGTTTITISPVGALVATPGTPYTLIRYTGNLSGSAANLNVVSGNPRYTFTVLTPAGANGAIQVQISSTGSTLDVWKGLASPNPSAWDVSTTYNWMNGGAASWFFNGDTAVFDNTALTNGVDLVGTLSPAAIIVSNNVTPYTFRGAGGLQAGTLTLDATSAGGLTIANAASNTFVGAGITLGTNTTLTLNQPASTFLNSALIGPGTLAKLGANTLTIVGNSDGTFGGTNLISNGTLQPGSVGALGGTNATIVAAGGTLNLNGKAVSASVFASGAGNGAGAVDNTGTAVTSSNSVTSLVLTGPTTLGASSNRWDVGRWIPDASYGAAQPPYLPVGAAFNAQSNTLVKVGAGDVWINAGGETYLADVNLGAGRLVVSNPTWSNNVPPTLGYPQNTITISNGATFGLDGGFPYQMHPSHDWGVDGGAKPIHILGGGTLESLSGLNILGGNVTLETGAAMKSDEASGLLTLNGTVAGPGNLVVSGNGGIQLAAANSYGTTTLINGATLVPTVPEALPLNSVVVLSNSPSSLRLGSSVTMRSDASLRMLSIGAGGGGQGPILAGDGTWTGPISLEGSQGFVFNGSLNGLNLTGPLTATNASGTITVDFNSITFATPLRFQGQIYGSYASGLSQGTLNRPILTFEAQNYWTNMNVARARINIRANDALPPAAPISAGSLIAGFDDRTLIFDLGGFNQTLSSVSAPFGYINTFLIGNSSPDTGSILTYAGTGNNSWAVSIVDGDPEMGGGSTMGLTVTSGSLSLTATNTYSGPTTVSGGTLRINGPGGQLGNTPVMVSSAGTLGGTGVINGPVTNAAGGTLSPGIFIGTLTINNTLALQAGGTCYLKYDLGGGVNDMVVGLSALTYGGTLVLTNVGTQPLTNGAALKLFDAAAYALGGPLSIQPAFPAPGLMWDVSHLAVDGTLRVAALSAPVVAAPGLLTDGNVGFSISGLPGQPYTVRASTDATLPLTSWTVIQSGNLPAATYSFTDTSATNYPQRFYRISTP